MIGRRSFVVGGLLAASMIAGTAADKPRPSVAREVGEYRVLTADFHVHSFPFSWGTLAPWDIVNDARHSGLDIALDSHNGTWVANLAAGFRTIRGSDGDRWRGDRHAALSLAGHRHHDQSPYPYASPAGAFARFMSRGVWQLPRIRTELLAGLRPESLALLDGAEIVRPETIFTRAASDLQSSRAAAPSRSDPLDYHGMGPVGFAARTSSRGGTARKP
jgi:hypothetical protein